MHANGSDHKLQTDRAGLLRRIIRQAFVDCVPITRMSYIYDSQQHATLPPILLTNAAKPVLLGVPCLFERSRGNLSRMLSSLQGSAHRVPAHRCSIVMVVAMQYRHAKDRDACLAALQKTETLWVSHSNLPFVGVALEGCSKIRAINVLAQIAKYWHVHVVGWFDDDILVDQDCVGTLLSEQLIHPTAIVAAGKIAIPDRTDFSTWWARRKNSIEPRNRYPHGCGLVLSQEMLGDGIPICYHTDDHYLLFAYLNPSAADPYERLIVSPTAIVYVPAPNTPSEVIFRVARNFRNVLRILADTPSHTARYFLRKILFADFRVPTGISEVLSIVYWRRTCWQILKLVFWLGVTADVVLRGLVRRPRGIQWYSTQYPASLQHSDGYSAID